MLENNLKIDKLTLISTTYSTIRWDKDRTKVSYRSNWKVVCDCGVKLVKTGQWLRKALRGKIKGRCTYCALASRPQTVNKMSTYERVYKMSILTRAKKKDIPVELTLDQFVELASKECNYCGKSPVERSWSGVNKYMPVDTFSLNGIDRIDSAKGYILDNCVPCCKTCNTAKGTLSVEEFKKHIRSIYEHLQMGK